MTYPLDTSFFMLSVSLVEPVGISAGIFGRVERFIAVHVDVLRGVLPIRKGDSDGKGVERQAVGSVSHGCGNLFDLIFHKFL